MTTRNKKTWPETTWPTPDFSDFPAAEDFPDFPPMEWPEEKGAEDEVHRGP